MFRMEPELELCLLVHIGHRGFWELDACMHSSVRCYLLDLTSCIQKVANGCSSSLALAGLSAALRCAEEARLELAAQQQIQDTGTLQGEVPTCCGQRGPVHLVWLVAG